MAKKAIDSSMINRFARFYVAESAAATFTQISMDTQLSIDRGFIWMIHSVEMSINVVNLDDALAAGNEYLQCQVTRESKDELLQLNDADLLCFKQKTVKRYAAIGTDAGPVCFLDQQPDIQKFDPPLPFAGQNIFIGVMGSAAAAKSVYGRIGYTLKKVSDKFFFEIAQALVS